MKKEIGQSLTKAERRKVYKAVAELFETGSPNVDWFLCFALRDECIHTLGYDWFATTQTLGLFPEFALFEPSEGYDNGWWGGISDVARDEKILVLNFCIAMCK